MAEEISWLSVIIIILLTGAYSATTFLGTNTFDKCDEINLDQEKININRLMNHSLTASITLASTLLLQKFVRNDGLIFAGLLCTIGIIVSYYSYTIINEEMCKPLTKKSEREYITYGSPIIFGTMCLIILFLMSRKSN